MWKKAVQVAETEVVPEMAPVEMPVDAPAKAHIQRVSWPKADKTVLRLQRLTFADDKFDRKDIAEQLNNVIRNAERLTENQSLSISIDAAWGMGKTQFIYMWKSMVEGSPDLQKKWRIVYFNAWEHDDYGDPLAPLVSNICREYSKKVSRNEKLLEATAKLLRVGAYVVGTALCATNPALNGFGALVKPGIDAVTEKGATDFYSEYNRREFAKEDFRKAIEALIDKDKKLIIAIDELDRCRPTFAIETLEVMKHFFNIDNVVFVFSLDMQQLAKSISTIYGHNMDACGYLARFFDVQLRMPYPTQKQLLDFIGFSDLIRPQISALCETLKVSVRELVLIMRQVENIITSVEIFRYYIQDKSFRNRIEAGQFFYLFLVAIKLKDPENYSRIVSGRKVDTFVKIGCLEGINNLLQEICQYDLEKANISLLEKRRMNNKSDADGFVVSLIAFLCSTDIMKSDPDLTFGQWLERHMEVFTDSAELNNEKESNK